MSHDHHDHGPDDELALRAAALEAVLVENGLVTTDEVDAIVERYEHDLGPLNGARVVARAWVDPGYRERLLADGTTRDRASSASAGSRASTMIALENTPAVHNVVVCTLCSCYPWPVLGLPPTWYKIARLPRARRARAARRPAGVRARAAGGHRDPRLGLERRGALPRRCPNVPPGPTASTRTGSPRLVTRDRMIGTGLATAAT